MTDSNSHAVKRVFKFMFICFLLSGSGQHRTSWILGRFPAQPGPGGGLGKGPGRSPALNFIDFQYEFWSRSLRCLVPLVTASDRKLEFRPGSPPPPPLGAAAPQPPALFCCREAWFPAWNRDFRSEAVLRDTGEIFNNYWLYVYKYLHTYIHTCMHANTYIHEHLHTYIHRYIYIYIYIQTYTKSLQINIYIYMHTYTLTYLPTYKHTCIYIYIYICIYV